MEYMTRDIYIDMDGTLMNWSKGNVRKALIDIEDPDYYRTLEPTDSRLLDYLIELKYQGHRLHVLSAIPDYHNCDYVPQYKYNAYYNQVRKAKDYTIYKYFNGIFDSVNYTQQSESKADYVLKYGSPKNSMLIDDMLFYINDWKEKINDRALYVEGSLTLSAYLQSLVSTQGR